MTKELPVTYCGKTIQEWAEEAARNSLKLYRLRRDVESCVRDIDLGLLDEVQIGRTLRAAIQRSGTSND